VGIVTAAALARARNPPRADVPLTAVMDFVAVPVDALDTVRWFNRAVWNWLTHGRSPGEWSRPGVARQ
jgi:hypothetical protein